MPVESAWSELPRQWTSVQLPGYRQYAQPATYESFSYDKLPPISIDLDETFQWLLRYGTNHKRGLHQYERDIQPSDVVNLAARHGLKLPQSFELFMTSPELQSRVRSCTDCYLDPGSRVVETFGLIPGHLIHFLSDSQSCVHWYLHLVDDQKAAVLESPHLYCYGIDDPEWDGYPSIAQDCIDLRGLEFAYCAPSFSVFLFRFWIENEIWYAIEDEHRALKPIEIDYLNHYAESPQP